MVFSISLLLKKRRFWRRCPHGKMVYHQMVLLQAQFNNQILFCYFLKVTWAQFYTGDHRSATTDFKDRITEHDLSGLNSIPVPFLFYWHLVQEVLLGTMEMAGIFRQFENSITSNKRQIGSFCCSSPKNWKWYCRRSNIYAHRLTKLISTAPLGGASEETEVSFRFLTMF